MTTPHHGDELILKHDLMLGHGGVVRAGEAVSFVREAKVRDHEGESIRWNVRRGEEWFQIKPEDVE